ncbi:hypothetical protein D3C86_1728390 [compost metagenome]
MRHQGECELAFIRLLESCSDPLTERLWDKAYVPIGLVAVGYYLEGVAPDGRGNDLSHGFSSLVDLEGQGLRHVRHLRHSRG